MTRNVHWEIICPPVVHSVGDIIAKCAAGEGALNSLALRFVKSPFKYSVLAYAAAEASPPCSLWYVSRFVVGSTHHVGPSYRRNRYVGLLPPTESCCPGPRSRLHKSERFGRLKQSMIGSASVTTLSASHVMEVILQAIQYRELYNSTRTLPCRAIRSFRLHLA